MLALSRISIYLDGTIPITMFNQRKSIWLFITIVFLSSLVTIFVVKTYNLLHNNTWYVLLAGAIGLFVGLSELLNRYKSFRFIFSNLYSWLYMAINMLAAMLVLMCLMIYNINLGSVGTKMIGKTMVAGLGAMAFLRSSFFSYKDSGDKTVEIGPAALLNVFLRATERQFDQMVASKTLTEIGAIMKGLNFVSASKDLPIIILKSMLILSTEEQTKLSEEIGKLLIDDSTNNEVRNVTLGIIISRYSGIVLLKQAVEALQIIYKENKPAIQFADLKM